MNGFVVKTENNISIRFSFYLQEAPKTCAAFLALLPFSATFFHARISGNEIWSDTQPLVDCIQENASIYTNPGEVVIGPQHPARAKTSNCMGIYYGEGKGLDACNIFAKVFDEDKLFLKQLGNDIWQKGGQKLRFENIL